MTKPKDRSTSKREIYVNGATLFSTDGQKSQMHRTFYAKGLPEVLQRLNNVNPTKFFGAAVEYSVQGQPLQNVLVELHPGEFVDKLAASGITVEGNYFIGAKKGHVRSIRTGHTIPHVSAKDALCNTNKVRSTIDAFVAQEVKVTQK